MASPERHSKGLAEPVTVAQALAAAPAQRQPPAVDAHAGARAGTGAAANTRRSPAEPSLASRALRALTRREYSRAELQRKLSPHAESPEQLESVLDAMQAKGFLSDARAAEAMSRQKAARFGNARIRQELMAKGLDKELISHTLEALADSEWERAQNVWNSKFGHLSSHDLAWPDKQKVQAKQLRFMLGRGFSSDVVRKLMQRSELE